jgi:HK97 gp10 family phage protein
MAIKTTVQVLGLRELGEAMRGLASDVALKVSYQATAAGSQVIKKQYKRNLQANPSIDSGLVEKNIITKKVPKSRTPYTAEHVVTVRKRAYPGKQRRNTKQVANFLEFGTVKQKAEPGLGAAFRAQKENAVTAIVDKLRKRIAAVKPK